MAEMIFVSVAAFDWHSIKLSTLHMVPQSEATVMLVTVATHNLPIGVGVGVLTATVLLR